MMLLIACLSLFLSLTLSHTQLAKEAQKTAEKVTQTAGAIAEEVGKTDVGQAIRKVRKSSVRQIICKISFLKSLYVL